MDDDNYTEADRARMRFYLKEMEEKFIKHPDSLTLRNGIARVRQILGLPKTVEKIDPIVWLDEAERILKETKSGR